MFARKTCKLFPTQTKGKHIIIIPSVCIRKRKPVWFFVFCENRQKILCIQGKQSENMLSPSAWWQYVFWLFPLNTENFLSVFTEYKESNSFPFLCENRWNNCIMFSLCLRGKQSNCFPGKHELYMFSTSVFLEYRDDPQQCTSVNQFWTIWLIRIHSITILRCLTLPLLHFKLVSLVLEYPDNLCWQDKFREFTPCSMNNSQYCNSK